MSTGLKQLEMQPAHNSFAYEVPQNPCTPPKRQFMNHNDILLLGVKSRVIAVSKPDGQTLWSTELPSGMGLGQEFVTVLADDKHVFAHTHGKLRCLDLADGRILWTNELTGCGYGLSSLSFPGGLSAPDTTAAQQKFASQQAAAAAASTSAH